MCAPECAAPEIGVVQVGIEEAGPGSYEHDPDGRWSLDPFDQQVVRPSLASRGSIPWFGGEPVLVRTEAFSRAEPFSREEEGRDGEPLTDTERGIAIHGAGFHVTCVPVMLARSRGPLNLDESLSRRQTRLRAQVKAAVGAPARSLPRNERWAHRVRLDLVTCLFQQNEGVLVDLSTGGAGIALHCHLDAVPQAGPVTTLAFRIPDAVGSWRNISTLVRVAHVAPGVPGETKVGLTFDDPIDGSLDPMIEFLTIDRRLVTLGRRTMAKG